MSRRVLGALFLLLMALLTACGGRTSSAPAAAEPAKKKVIGVALPETENPFFVAMKTWLEKEAPAAGFELRISIVNRDVAKQTADLEGFVKDKVDGLIISAVDGNAIAKVVQAANAAKIPIVTLARTLPPPAEVLAHIGSDDVALGRMMGMFIAQGLKDRGGNVVLLRGPTTASYANNMEKGALEILKATANVTVLASVASADTQDEGRKQMEKLLAQFPQIDAVYAVNDPVALGAVEALKAAGRKNVIVAGANGSPAALDSIKADGMAYTLAKEPGKQSILALRAFADHFDGLPVRKTQYALGTGVTKANMSTVDIRYAK